MEPIRLINCVLRYITTWKAAYVSRHRLAGCRIWLDAAFHGKNEAKARWVSVAGTACARMIPNRQFNAARVRRRGRVGRLADGRKRMSAVRRAGSM
jgi:hypothetical protein